MAMAKIIPGPFAVVTSGNCTRSFMLDGDDIQTRADAAMDKYWSDTATVVSRGIQGFGVQIEGSDYIVDVYTTEDAAKRALGQSGDCIEVLYTFTTPVFYSKNGDTSVTYEFYWDSLIEEGGLRNSKTKRNTPIIRGFHEDQMYVGTRQEVLDVIAVHKRANNINE